MLSVVGFGRCLYKSSSDEGVDWFLDEPIKQNRNNPEQDEVSIGSQPQPANSNIHITDVDQVKREGGVP